MTAIQLFYAGLTLSVIALAVTAALFFVYQTRLRRLPESTRYEDLRERLEGVRAQLEAFEKERQALRDQLESLGDSVKDDLDLLLDVGHSGVLVLDALDLDPCHRRAL